MGSPSGLGLCAGLQASMILALPVTCENGLTRTSSPRFNSSGLRLGHFAVSAKPIATLAQRSLTCPIAVPCIVFLHRQRSMTAGRVAGGHKGRRPTNDASDRIQRIMGTNPTALATASQRRALRNGMRSVHRALWMTTAQGDVTEERLH